MGVGDVRQQAGQSALAVRSRSTADRRYSSFATTTDASDQAADMTVKFIALVDIDAVPTSEPPGHECRSKPRLAGRQPSAAMGCPG